MAINRVVIVGRLTRDPELRRTASQAAVVSFTVAVDDTPRKDGTQQTSFIPCQAWNATAENIQRFCHKGSLVGVDGRLNQRSYVAKDGSKKSIIEVIASSVQFLESKKAAASNSPVDSGNTESNENKADQPVEGIDSSDDDLPF